MNGGDTVAAVLKAQGVNALFTLCGGHISPILVAAKRSGIRVIDVRDEASAVFAADAVARMSGVPGVAAVTAGPGLTNTLTAVQNALLAQTPLIVLGGATATMLKGRGALQDIDQMALMRSSVKMAFAVKRVRDIGPTLEQAFRIAQDGVQGPVFVELPVDLLYDQSTVKSWADKELGSGKGLLGAALKAYARQHLYRTFRNKDDFSVGPHISVDAMQPDLGQVRKIAALLRQSCRPVIVVGAQTLAQPREATAVAAALRSLGAPVFLAGSARGLLGKQDALQFRHQRGAALRRADLVIVCGFPFDFRLQYGWKINATAKIVQVNRDRAVLRKNRLPSVAVHADGGRLLCALAAAADAANGARWADWFGELRGREGKRDAEIAQMADEKTEYLNPIALCRAIEAAMADDAIVVVDGGDFVATAAYVLRPRGPLAWLDPGVFGTLGVGGGFAVGAATVSEYREIWLFYGDGASAYSLAEFDTLARHGLAVIAVVGNDACWAQIARDQVAILGDDVGTPLARTDYHIVATGYGAKGLLLNDASDIDAVLRAAKTLAAQGHPVLISAWIGKTSFRDGSTSI